MTNGLPERGKVQVRVTLEIPAQETVRFYTFADRDEAAQLIRTLAAALREHEDAAQLEQLEHEAEIHAVRPRHLRERPGHEQRPAVRRMADGGADAVGQEGPGKAT